MKRKTIFTILFALVAITGWAKEDVVVWDMPTTEYGNAYGNGGRFLDLDVTRVELKDSETVVYITAKQYSDPRHWFQFADSTYLKVGDERYTIVSADNIELNQKFQTEKDNKRDMVFHFPPLPKDTKVFDFIEGDGERAFQIKGIKPIEERWKQLLPSYWRDEQGDWKIAFLDDCAIYDCKFWTYKQCDVNSKTGEAQMVLCNGDNEMKVMVGKDKKGQRTIQIGDQKATYSMITSRFMPDYPTKDTRTDFVNNGYKHDTITVVGWLKDMPEHFKNLKTFEFTYENYLVDYKREYVYADLDEQGRFTAKIPVINSTDFLCDWSRCVFGTILEAGKTYFMLYDFKEGRRYFMGDDCRLQNELFKHGFPWDFLSLSDIVGMDGRATPEDLDGYITSVDSLLKTQYAKLDSLCQAHPTLSSRFYLYEKNTILTYQAECFGQTRFRTLNMELSANARKYAYDTFWTKMPEPVTMYLELSMFLSDYLADASWTCGTAFSYNFEDHIENYASNEEELAILTRYKELQAKTMDTLAKIRDVVERENMWEEISIKNADLIKQVTEILKGAKARRYASEKILLKNMKACLNMLDSLNASPFIRDIHLTRMVCHEIDHEHCSLKPDILDTFKILVSNPLCIEVVEKKNNEYLAIENREFDKLVLKSSDELKGISEGEALLKKLIEPYKGKFVLLDIWGTWCRPCKEALSHSAEEYARLKDFDIQYLYLANNSPQDSWENIIKEYNVTGDNAAHYNLPREQQAAIEQYLKVSGFPTYKLFDRDGNLLDLEINPRNNLENLAKLLERLNK